MKKPSVKGLETIKLKCNFTHLIPNGMKKKLLLIIIVLSFGYNGIAQYKPVLFGLRLGTNIGWMKPDTEDYESEGVRVGFGWGFIAEFFIMENYAIQTGFNMNFNGGKLKYPYMGMMDNDTILGELHRKYNLKYLQIPLCLKMQTDITEKLRIFGKIGLGTGFNLSSKATDEFTYEGGSQTFAEKNIDDEVALIRSSLIVGGGIEIIIKGSTAVKIGLVYDNAFNNMLTWNDPMAIGSDAKAFHNFVELEAGIVF
jgi:hypothetical protein